MLKSQEQSKNSDASMLRRLSPKLASTKRTRSLHPLLLCMKVKESAILVIEFLIPGGFHEIHDGVSKMVDDLLKLC